MSAHPIVDGTGVVVGVVCTTDMHEVVRKRDGEERWCFHCRRVRQFDYVVLQTIEPSYYGPSFRIECVVCHTDDGDCFPGRYRIWDEL